MSIEQNRKHGRGQGADGGRQQQQPHRKMRLLLQQDHQAQKGKEIGSKCRYECSGGEVETKKKKKDGMVLRIRDNNKTAADSVHLQHITRRKRIIPETLENYRLPRRKVAFSSDRMVPTGPNPVHNSNRSEVIIP
jgi:hypothetical protein